MPNLLGTEQTTQTTLMLSLPELPWPQEAALYPLDGPLKTPTLTLQLQRRQHVFQLLQRPL